MLNAIPQTFKGKVVRKKIGKGSKSEREANIILTDCGKEFVLRQKGKNALEDPELDALEGKTIEVTGMIHAYVLIISSYEEIQKEEAKENNTAA